MSYAPPAFSLELNSNHTFFAQIDDCAVCVPRVQPIKPDYSLNTLLSTQNISQYEDISSQQQHVDSSDHAHKRFITVSSVDDLYQLKNLFEEYKKNLKDRSLSPSSTTPLNDIVLIIDLPFQMHLEHGLVEYERNLLTLVQKLHLLFSANPQEVKYIRQLKVSGITNLDMLHLLFYHLSLHVELLDLSNINMVWNKLSKALTSLKNNTREWAVYFPQLHTLHLNIRKHEFQDAMHLFCINELKLDAHFLHTLLDKMPRLQTLFLYFSEWIYQSKQQTTFFCEFIEAHPTLQKIILNNQEPDDEKNNHVIPNRTNKEKPNETVLVLPQGWFVDVFQTINSGFSMCKFSDTSTTSFGDS